MARYRSTKNNAAVRAATENVNKLFRNKGFDDVCNAIARGLTLHRYCVDHNLNYTLMIHSISLKTEREEQYQKAIAARREYLGEVTIEGLLAIATSDIRTAFLGDALLAPDQIPDSLARAIESIEITDTKEGTKRRIKLESKLQALIKIGQYAKVLLDHEVEVKIGLSDLILQASEPDTSNAPAKP